MLSIKNPQDLEQIKKFGRAKDMVILHEFFPELCDIKDLFIVESEKDYNDNIKTLGEIGRKRPDSLLGTKVIKGTQKGTPDENIEIMRYIKQQDPNGVMIMFTNKSPFSEKRYEGEGGMSIAVDVGKGVIIECVGSGFDGGDLTHGHAVHESYSIGWNDINKFNLGNRKQYRSYLVEQETYEKQVEQRIKQLEKYGYDKSDFERKIPNEYSELPNDVFQYIMPSIKKLVKLEQLLKAQGLNSFSINGEVEYGRFVPIQMPTEERHKKLHRETYIPKCSKSAWIKQGIQEGELDYDKLQ